jgi:hypothetical protein
MYNNLITDIENQLWEHVHLVAEIQCSNPEDRSPFRNSFKRSDENVMYG